VSHILRPYQHDALVGIFSEFEKHRSALCVMPTGSGKTIVMAKAVERIEGRVMIIAHRRELISQAREKVSAVTGEQPDVEMGEQWADVGFLGGKAKVVIASIQSLASGVRGAGRIVRFNPLEFGLVMIDEAHHGAANSYETAIAHFMQNPKCKLLGVTATPNRGDEQALGKVFEGIGYRYELFQAIRDGWLVTIHQTAVAVKNLDFSNVRTSQGDFNSADLAAVMEEEEILHGIATPTFEIAAGRKALVFCVSREHARILADIFNRHKSNCSAFVDCETPDDERRAIFADFKSGKIQILCNVNVTTEGFDEPGVQVVVMANPTKSQARYAQMVGRGTRPLPGLVDAHADAADRRDAITSSAKPFMEVIDFCGNTGRHTLAGVADVLGGDFSEAAKKRVKDAHSEGKSLSADVIDELKRAEADIIREQEQQAEREKRKSIIATATYTTKTNDPFSIFNIAPLTAQGFDRCKKPTPKMLEVLTRNGIATENQTFTSAKQLIGVICERRTKNLCTFKQARTLKKYGYQTDIGFTEASAIITAIVSNGWRRPAQAGV